MSDAGRSLRLPAGWYGAAAAEEETIGRLVQWSSVPLPPRYLEFLRVSNGGEGTVNGRYVSLWPAEDIGPLNTAYGITHFLPRSLAIGTDGGDYAYVLDGRDEQAGIPVLEIELGSLALAYAVAERIASSFEELVGPL